MNSQRIYCFFRRYTYQTDVKIVNAKILFDDFKKYWLIPMNVATVKGQSGKKLTKDYEWELKCVEELRRIGNFRFLGYQI